MKKRLILALVVLFISISCFSQVGVDLRKYKFGEIPTTTAEEDEQFKDHSLLILTSKYVLDYYVNNEEFNLWELKHQAFKILKEEEIEDFNELTFGRIELEKIKNIQVRVINNGEVVKTYTKKDIETIKEVGDREDDFPIIKIKLADIKIGTIIEFFYTRIRPSIIEQGDYFLQTSSPTKEISYTIIMPKHLKPHVQLYNGDFPILDTVIDSKSLRYTVITIPFLPALKSEPISFQKKHCVRVEFNYAYNLSKNRIRLNTTKDFVNNFYDRTQLTDKKIIKLVKKNLIKNIKIDKNATVEQKIRIIEDKLKESIYGVSTMQTIRIFNYVFDHFDIKYDLVLTCNKNEKEFDKSYNGSNFYDEILYFFPAINKYMAPMQYSYRLGLIPMYYNGNMAIYLKKIELGKTKSFTHTFKTIPVTPKSVTIDGLKLNLALNVTNGKVSGTIEREMGGYRAHYIQSNFKAFEVEDTERLLEQVFSLGYESMNIENERFENTDSKDVGINPMVCNAEISISEWAKVNPDGSIELYIGKMIGKQDKIEQKTPRVLPIERAYTSSYKREIKIAIPEGYKVTEFSAVDMFLYDTEDPTTATAGFKAFVLIKDGFITITSTEFYDKLYYAPEEFDLISRVVNLAADFNDFKLILIKK